MKFEAMNREEAIDKALEYFHCTAEKLKIVEVEKPHKKIMGFKKIPGRYEIEMMEEENVPKKADENQNGTIEIRSGEMTITNPQGRGVDASVFLNHPQVIMTVNGEARSGTQTLRAEDDVSFAFEDIRPKRHLTVDFSEDLLRAYLKVERIKGIRYSLKDLEKTFRAQISPHEEEIETDPLTEEECIKVLMDFGVLPEFIDRESLKKACNAKDTIRVVAAAGKAPVESRQTEIRYCDEIFVKDILRGLEPVISTGSLLAEKLSEAVMGVPGMDVKGNEINVQKVTDRDIESTEGAEMRGNRIYALRDGRPYLKNGQVGVLPLLTVVGDLDKDTEDIDFDGDVVVKGNVQDNMVIKASGNISIIGSVYHSEINAHQNVEIQGKIIGGRIHAGDENSAFNLLLTIIEKMIVVTEEIFSGLHMTEGRGVQGIMDSIHEGKEKIGLNLDEMDRIRSLFNEKQKETIDRLKRSFAHCFKEIRLLHKEGFIELNDLYEMLKNMAESMKLELQDQRVIKLVYAQNATITSSGDIIITGEGSYQAKLSAGNEIRYERPGNVVIGGTLIAGKFIRAGVIGTPSEIETFCKVMDEEGDILGRFHKGTTLMIKDRIREYMAIV
ncbi:FapA family protein [Proteiniclasticum sp.]|uniref:FapA family protein n=1 Tax=Proteiniclasticum sp. TaxID=2053595 RepID=UPI00289F9B82|nr:FapA family protein [Proteiniclasticum sp.]